MIDLDGDVEYGLDELVSGLRFTPSIAYTTYSHNQERKGKPLQTSLSVQDCNI